ncbi:DUF4365 domain-containing protein [Dactylosporangium siamense]|uniref:DUF4365 domain-containing protein n=1 Tax=Dactylosporangium siamense TaxID=685454 RepID=A0A919U9M6_9ACTN|nr:DUF4365 domain-containing protein [Dactylosporangium siamense]GIG47679.1 hypothetical protein Dsi01nite_057200 [Dactylosporangium siamense]
MERAAVNALRTLLEAHDHIVQEIDGGNDHGEDLYVTLTEGARRTGDTIAIQAKGGRSFAAKGGYRVPAGDHAEFWLKSNVPIVCVVFDPDSGALHWGNASQQLRQAARDGVARKSISILSSDVLSDVGVGKFVRQMRGYISETAELHRFLTKISGSVFDTTDFLSYFENEDGERLIFQQRRGVSSASLLHSDLDWQAEDVTLENFHLGVPGMTKERKMDAFSNVFTAGNAILDPSEGFWLMACLLASVWHRQQPPMRH